MQLHACRALLQISGDVTVSVTILGANHRKRFLELHQRLYNEHTRLLDGCKSSTNEASEARFKLKNSLFLAEENTNTFAVESQTQNVDDVQRGLYMHP